MSIPPDQCELLLIRHGQTVFNIEHRIQGQLDSPLTREGLKQAMRVADRITHYRPDILLSSDSERARNTAWFIAQKTNLPIHESSRWRERHFGVWSGMTSAEIKEDYPDDYTLWRSGDPDAGPLEGETPREFYQRVAKGMKILQSNFLGKRVVLVSHGGTIGMALRYVLGIPLAQSRRYEVINTSITQMRFMGDHWMLWRFGDVSHLKRKKASDRDLS